MSAKTRYSISVYAVGDKWRANVYSDGLEHYAEGHSPAAALAELAHFWERTERRSDMTILMDLVMDARKAEKETK